MHLLIEPILARVEEESTKITNQLFVKGASNAASTSNNNDEPLSAATFVSVVSNFVFWFFFNSERKC